MCVCVCVLFVFSLLFRGFCGFFWHIVYYAKRKMQYFLLCRYVADKNIYNLAVPTPPLSASPHISIPKASPPTAAVGTKKRKKMNENGSHKRKRHRGRPSSHQKPLPPTVGALHKKRPHTIRLSSKAVTSIFECFIYCKIDMVFYKRARV